MIAKVFGDLKEILTLRSLQARIFIIVLVMGIIPCVVMRYGILDNYEERAVENRISYGLFSLHTHILSNTYTAIATNVLAAHPSTKIFSFLFCYAQN